MLLYENFFRKYGVRLPQHLMMPKLSSLTQFEFPRNSAFHSLTFDGVQSGPRSDEYLFRLITKPILIHHVLGLGDIKGAPRLISQQVFPYIQEYHKTHRRFRLLRDLDKLPNDQNTLLVLNYGFASKSYRYVRNVYTEYYKWWNLQASAFKEINKLAKESSRQQYLFASLPKIIPAIGTLNNYSHTFNSTMVSMFNTSESLILLELWKWLGESNNKDSVFSFIEEDNLNKVNLVYQEGNNWMLFNLGILNSWRFSKIDDHGPDPVTAQGQADLKEKVIAQSLQKVKITPEQLQKRVLRSLVTLMGTRLVPIDPETNEVEAGSEVPTVVIIEAEADQALDEETRLEKANRTLATMDADLEELAVIENHISVSIQETKQEPISGLIDVQDFHNEETIDGAIIASCDKLAEDGLLTAVVYSNLLKAAKSYKSIPSFDPNKTLEEFVKIEPEEVAISETRSIPDIATVTDKTMLRSSLLSFDERYIEKILTRDVAGMVVNIQKAGVILTNYTVDRRDDVLGSFELHTLRVRPVEGVASTIHFRLPVVDSDGIITSNSNKYVLRKQRGDIPLRKTGPDTVALTSYYGKTFVQRSPKRVNNYAGWLTNQIMSKGLAADDNDIIDLQTANVFDNIFKGSRVFTTLSMTFKGFTAGEYSFNFDHTKREFLYGSDAVKQYEKNSIILFASGKKGNYLGIDKADIVYEFSGANVVQLGTLEGLLKIDPSKAPVEYSEVKIFGKNIPVGFFLGYQLGLSKLMALLKVEPRRVTAGARLNLQSHEFAITFSDSALVFSREDKLASMILAGLNEFSKTLRKFAVASMDKPNVYLNILEGNQMTVRILREIDLMTSMFVDPITRELLIEMKEPTTVRGLLVRSSELLLQDQHPDQMDMRYMRIKGYERLSGAVYSELVQAIRGHNSRVGKSTRPIELDPYAVWKRVVQDPAMNMVSDINPIQNLKEMEAVTYSGIGGRNTRSMTKATREFHETDTGVISESTVDSSQVGVNIYTSADPQFKSLRGTTNLYKPGKTGATALLSTSALLSPGSDQDD